MNTPTKSNDSMTRPGAPTKKPPVTESTPNAETGAVTGAYHSLKDVSANLFGSNKDGDNQDGGKKRRSMKKSRKSRKSRKSKKGGNPKKGMASKTRKGRKDYVTHKGDKYYNRKGKRQTKNRKGRKGKPYSKRR